MRLLNEIERETYNDSCLQDARSSAPKQCRNCDNLRAGTNHNQRDQLELIAVCDKFPDGVPADPNECLNLPDICLKCDSYTDCHFSGAPKLDVDAVAYCQVNNEAYVSMENTLINRVLFN